MVDNLSLPTELICLVKYIVFLRPREGKDNPSQIFLQLKSHPNAFWEDYYKFHTFPKIFDLRKL